MRYLGAWRRIGRAFLGRLASGPNPPASGRGIGRAFLGLLVSGSFPFGALRLGWLARGARPGPKVPTKASYRLPLRVHH